MRKFVPALGSLWVSLALAGAVTAQNTTVSCQALLRVALENARTNCAALGSNQICYGNVDASATARADAAPLTFDQPGSLADLAAVQSLRVKTLDFSQSQYGIAWMNLSLTPGAAESTNLLLGDGTVTSRVVDIPVLTMQVNQGINVRGVPEANGALIGSLAAGAEVTATGRTVNKAGEEWIRIEYAQHVSGTGWVIGWALNTAGDRSTLASVQPGDLILRPMESFQLATGYGDAPCDPAPDSGLLMQTPPGGRIMVWINGIKVDLSGTAFLQTDPNGMTVSNLSGDLDVSLDSAHQTVPVGALSRVPLGADGLAAAAPDFPEGYVYTVLQRLPLDLLPQTVDLVAPLSIGEIVDLLSDKFPANGTWTVSGQAAACFPSTSSPAVFSSDWFLGTGALTFSADHSSFTFTGGPGGPSTHTQIGPDQYSLVYQDTSSKTIFTTRIVDPQTLVTDVSYAYRSGAGNCTSSATWTWTYAGG